MPHRELAVLPPATRATRCVSFVVSSSPLDMRPRPAPSSFSKSSHLRLSANEFGSSRPTVTSLTQT